MARYTRHTPEQQAAAIVAIAEAFHAQGVDMDTAAASVLAVLDTSSQVVNNWAFAQVAMTYARLQGK